MSSASISREENSFLVQQILLGLEEIYPQETVISKLRFFLEKIIDSEYEQNHLIQDLFEVLKLTGDYPVNAHLSILLESEDPSYLLTNLLRLVEHFSYNPFYKNLKVMLKFFDLKKEDEQNAYNSVVLLLEEQKDVKGYEYLFYIRQILLEKKSVERIKKILDFLIHIYNCEKIIQLKKMIDHFVKLNADLQVWKFLMLALPENQLIERIKSSRAMFPETRLHEAFSKGQILSKLWLCDELKKLDVNESIKNTIVLCGWYGTLPFLLIEKLSLDTFIKVRCVDIDPDCEKVGNHLNQTAKDTNHKYRSTTADVYELDYKNTILFYDNETSEGVEEVTEFDCIINTSSEHLQNFDDWYKKIPSGKLLIMQSNDFFNCDEHVNCVKNLESFVKQCPMSEVLYKGELKLEKYNRFMIIGRK